MSKTAVAQQAKTEHFLPSSQGILQRKCACGNQAVGDGECTGCAKKKMGLQRKLTIGASNDPLEKEADRVAEQVMAAPAHSAVNKAPLRIQRYARQASEGAGTAPASVNRVLASSGRPMEPVLRQDMEQRFGHDFSPVRVHSGAAAEQSARDVSARAYTAGNNVVFGAGQLAPRTHEGRRLIAHELTHVVQQCGSTNINTLRPVLGKKNSRRDVQEANRVSQSVAYPSVKLNSFSAGGGGILQRQLITPYAAGGGYGGLMERDRSRAMSTSGGSARSTAAPLLMRRLKVWLNTFIPFVKVNGPPFSGCFTGDGRSFSNAIHASSRTHQEIEFDVTTLSKTIDWKRMGTTHEINCTTGAVINSGTAPVSQLHNGAVRRSGTDFLVDFRVNASNPLVSLAPAINAEVVFRINPITRVCGLTGEHDGFPAYEAYVTADSGAGVPVYTYGPSGSGMSDIRALFPPMDETISGSSVGF